MKVRVATCVFVVITAPFAACVSSGSGDDSGTVGVVITDDKGGVFDADDTKGLTCAERVYKSEEMIASALDDNQTCQTTNDCTTVKVSTDCRGACVEAVNKSGLTVVQEAVSQANEVYCEDFEEDDCLYATTGCMYLVPTCDSTNRCVMAIP